ncbi:mechanosensitive ion channel, partial [Gammaproteobacteria bacterium]|nr:mechanosensitive ion channel [Gammaproteobacteria bacterium]
QVVQWGIGPAALDAAQRPLVVDALLVLAETVTFGVYVLTIVLMLFAPIARAWRLVPVPDRSAVHLSGGLLLGSLVGYMSSPRWREFSWPDGLTTVVEQVGAFVVCLVLLWLTRSVYWQRDRSPPPLARTMKFGRYPLIGLMVIRYLLMATAVLGLVAILFGRYGFDLLVTNIVVSVAITLGLGYLGLSLLSRLLNWLMLLSFWRTRYGLRMLQLNRARSLLAALLGPLGLLATLIIIAWVWGASVSATTGWLARFWADGVTVGDFTLSPKKLLLAVFIWWLVTFLARKLREITVSSVMPSLEVPQSSAYAIGAMIKYAGVIFAALFAVAALGVTANNMAIVLSALSVGIGFGLREIVNNFVSGLILIVEQPIKVGDWIKVGEFEGTVTEVNIRSTEIRSFVGAAIIVPNAQLLTSAVVNNTHETNRGRVDIKLPLPLDVDLGRARDVALAVVENNSHRNDEEPRFLVQQFMPDRIDAELRVFLKDITYCAAFASEVRIEVRQALHDAGIDLPLPKRQIVSEVSDASTAKIVATD